MLVAAPVRDMPPAASDAVLPSKVQSDTSMDGILSSAKPPPCPGKPITCGRSESVVLHQRRYVA